MEVLQADSYERYLYDNRVQSRNKCPYHEQIAVVKVSGPSASLKDGSLTLGSISGTVYTGGWEFEHVDLSLLDFGHAKVAAVCEHGNLEISAMASAWTPSVTFEVFGADVKISGHVGSIGGSLDIGAGKFNEAGAYGFGIGVSVDWYLS